MARTVIYPERMERVELSLSVWKTEVLPLNDIRMRFPEGSNLVPALLHSAALPGELENHRPSGSRDSNPVYLAPDQTR